VAEEVKQGRGELVGGLLGLVVAGVDRAAAQLAGRPRPPDRLGIAVDVEVIIRRGEQQHRALDLPARGSVGFLVPSVGAQAGTVVLAHAVDDGRVTERRPRVWPGPAAYPLRCPARRAGGREV
jgi:hypothetical protein